MTNAMLSTKSSFRGSRSGSTRSKQSLPPIPPPSRPPRKKRSASNSLSSDSDVIRSIGSNNLHPDFDTSSDERDKSKGSKPKKAPPLPLNPPNLSKLKLFPGFRTLLIVYYSKKIEARGNFFRKVKVIERS